MISYVGGKKQQAKWIGGFIPPIDKYVEIFGGAMWCYINGKIICNKATYNDYNKYMYNLFTCCCSYNDLYFYAKQLDPYNQEIFDMCQKFFLDKGSDYIVPDFDLAACYAYISTHVFSGILKPTGNRMAKDNGSNPGSKYRAFVKRLNNVEIQEKFDKLETYNLNYDKAIELFDSSDNLLYLDPPYYGTEDYYSFHSFGFKDHKRLSEILNNCKSKIILSYYDFPELKEWYPADRFIYKFKEFSKISSSKSVKNKGTEILIMNYER
mgnify:CR=1 FL=1